MDKHERRWYIYVRNAFIVLALYCLAFVAAYFLTAWIYMFTGKPPELCRHLISGITAIVFVMVIWRLLLQIRGGPLDHNVRHYHDQLTDALARMAQGDFDVLLDLDTIGRYNEIAEAFNDMAKNLGTLETMRQDFISNVSHEIQSPLTSIGGFAALLKKDGLPDEERQRYADIIEAESKRLSSLSDNLLKLSTLDSNKTPLNKKDFRLDKQIENITLTLEPQWSAKNLAVEADMQKLTVYGDEDLLSQVWVNLLHNAVKFTPDDGQINIALSEETESAHIKINDTGFGITPDDQIHIFERFYKADKARDRSLGGNGLGLSLVKKIVELHSGSIIVESEFGKGTAFTVTLPKK